MDGAPTNDLFNGIPPPTSAATEVHVVTDIDTHAEESMVVSGENAASESSNSNPSVVREQDPCMPIANIIRIMRMVLPAHAKISDDAKESMQKCVSKFISLVTSKANERCHRELRKTVTAEDLLWSMSSLRLDNYIEPLTMYLHRYCGSVRGFPLPPPRCSAPAIGAAPTATEAPPIPIVAPPLPPLSIYRDGFNMYGSGDESSGISSSEAPPMNHTFYPYRSFK